MRYKIGLDIGITSVGWATVELNENDEPIKIIDLGTRIFDAAENPKDGSSLAAPRRNARGARRRLRRHKHRLERIRNLIVDSNLLSAEELEHLYEGKLSDIYEIRAKSLERRLTNSELARLLIHLAQRRGFKSNRKTEAKDKEAGKLLTAVAQNASLLQEKGYRTIGEMLFYDDKFNNVKRNKSEDYSHTIGRDLIVDEVTIIFDTQLNMGSQVVSKDFQEKYLNILTSQRPFDVGPGGNSPYGGDQIEKMIGFCTFEEGIKRAPKAAYSFEYFTLLQNINNMRIISPTDSRVLSDNERKALIELAHNTADLKFSRLRKTLDLSDEEYFSALSYGANSFQDIEEKTKFNYLKAYHQMRKALDKIKKGTISQLSKEQLNTIARALTIYKSDEKIRNALIDAQITKDYIDTILDIGNFSKFGHLSVEACDKLIPHLEKGLKYNEACEAAGYVFKSHANKEKTMFLPSVIDEFENITNPVVRRAVSQTIKVINSIIRKYNQSPCMLSIELAREMSKPYDERKKLEKDMRENQIKNEKTIERIKEYGISNPTGMDLVKFKLWEDQGGICPYSQKNLHIDKLFDIGYADIDHIIPYSISLDDGYKNKVLVFAEQNRQKGNKLPMQYLSGVQKEQYIVWVQNNIRDFKKRQRLLKEKLTEEDLQGFKERNLQDTKYISKLLYNFINDYLEFAPLNTGRKKRVSSVNGAVTSYMRKRWGISKLREDGDLHHAVDAVVVACITDGMIQRVSSYSKFRELCYVESQGGAAVINKKTGEIKHIFPLPWPYFRKELEARLSSNPAEILSKLNFPEYTASESASIRPVFISRMPKRKISGAAHKDTVKSPKELEKGFVIQKKALADLKLDKYMHIDGYYRPQDDAKLYELLRSKLIACNGDAKKAFEEKVYKPTKDDSQGPEVKKVKIMEKSTLNVSLNKGKGAADNDSMVRIDIFHVQNDGYYFVPIYLADTVKASLPSKACIAYKSYEQWIDMDDEDFIFSLYPNDLVKVTHKNAVKMSLVHKESTLPKEKIVNEAMLYFVSAGISTAAISAINHDKTYKIDSLGIKTLKYLEKYQVDILGGYHKVGIEKRQHFKNKDDK